MSDFINRDEVWQALHNIGGCDADTDSWADGWDKAIDAAIDIVETLPTTKEDAPQVSEASARIDCVLSANIGKITLHSSIHFLETFTLKDIIVYMDSLFSTNPSYELTDRITDNFTVTIPIWEVRRALKRAKKAKRIEKGLRLIDKLSFLYHLVIRKVGKK